MVQQSACLVAVQQRIMAGQLPSCVSVKKAALRRRGLENFQQWAALPYTTYIGRSMEHYVPG